MPWRFLFVCAALLVLMNAARGEGNYQRTRNGKTLVWNNHPKFGDEATWSGSRDRGGYARGFGTLIWYTKQSLFARPTPYGRYSGNMVRGKFNGPVNVHSKGKTHYAIFAGGVRRTRWATGPAPPRGSAQLPGAIASQNIEPEAPGEGPMFQGSEIRSRMLEGKDQSEGWPGAGIDDSLQRLVWPPPSLYTRRASNLAARLTKGEVVDLADAVARAHGYDLTEYQRPKAQYDPADQIWLLFYDQNRAVRKYFIVAVGDRSKRITVIESRK
jgi:hypothetical protein